MAGKTKKANAGHARKKEAAVGPTPGKYKEGKFRAEKGLRCLRLARAEVRSGRAAVTRRTLATTARGACWWQRACTRRRDDEQASPGRNDTELYRRLHEWDQGRRGASASPGTSSQSQRTKRLLR